MKNGEQKGTGESTSKVALRRAIAAMEGDLERLAEPSRNGDDRARLEGLWSSWRGLLAVLAIEPAPASRQCPVCDTTVMRAATRCIGCWSKLTPPDAAA